MPYRILCNDVRREGVKASQDLASELFYYIPLHKIGMASLIASTLTWIITALANHHQPDFQAVIFQFQQFGLTQ